MNLPLPFEFLGPYRLLKPLGKGGMGSVYVGKHVKDGDLVAVKLIAEHVADEPRFRRRFDAEIESLKKLDHPNIIRLIGYGEQKGRLFYSMELAEGESLQGRIRRLKKLPWEDAIDLAVQICAALKHAHDIGVIHRDLKPANLVITESDTVKLVDFGIAKIFGDTLGQTMAGSVLGTADYMAPEQAVGEGITQRTDLYALGSVMFAMVAGRPPFRGKNITAVIDSLRHEDPPKLDSLRPETPDELVHLVNDLLSKDPSDRPPTALAVSKRLRSMRAGLQRDATMLVDHPDASTGEITGVVDTDTDHRRPAPSIAPGASALPTDLSGPLGDGSAVANFPISHPQAVTMVSSGGGRTKSPTAAPSNPSADTADRDTHYQLAPKVAGEEDASEQSIWGTVGLVAGLVATLVIMVTMIALGMRQPSADDLFARAQTGDRAAADSFLARHGDDPRADGLRENLLSKRSEAVARRLEVQSRLGVTELTPAEEAFLGAMAVRQSDPKQAMERMKGWLALFGEDVGEGSEEMLKPFVQHEMRTLAAPRRLPTLDPRAIELMTKINLATQAGDDDQTRTTLQGIVDAFGDKDWARPAVREAQLQLEVMEEFGL